MSKAPSSSSHRRDLYAEITEQLVAQIEADPGKPQMPWRRFTGAPLWMPRNAATEDHYRGINIIMLWAAAESRGFTAPVWATYKQWQEIGAQVRGGEKGSRIVKYGEYQIEPGDAAPEDDDGKRLYLKAYTVFNASQVDGFQLPEPPPSLGPIERIERAEAFLANLGMTVEIGGDRAFYRPSTDTIHMPDEGLFTGTATMTRTEGWYATSAHEHGHATSHPSRCDRQLGKRFGDKEYCAEELVAEIISAQICAALGITQDVRPDHAQYLAQWLELMKSDAKAIFTAAAAASKAVDFMFACQPPGLFPEFDRRNERALTEHDDGMRAAETARPLEHDPQHLSDGSYAAPERSAATNRNVTRHRRPREPGANR